MLTEAQRNDFVEQGVLVVEDFYTGEACDALRARMGELVEAVDPADLASVFSTTNRQYVEDEFFLRSGSEISFFLEEDAVDEAGTLLVPLDRAFNKAGHAMHDLDPVFSKFSRSPSLASVAADVGIADPLLLQSMYIFKPPRIGGEVVWHTDHPFLWTEPRSVVGFWVAIEDATVDNGCLWCLPGKHRLAPKERFRRTGPSSTATEILDPTPFPLDEGVPLEARKGTLVVIDGLLPHWSAPNTSDQSRHAYTLHVIDGRAEYPADNWLQRSPSLPLQGF